MILFQNILLLKEFLVCNGCFGLFTKIIKRSGTCFCCTFSAWFFYKDVLYLCAAQIKNIFIEKSSSCSIYGQSFSVIPFFLLKIPNKHVIEFLYRQLITSWTLRFIFDHPVLKQWPTGRKEGRTEIQKFEYLENEKSFADEIKIIFHSFWRAII